MAARQVPDQKVDFEMQAQKKTCLRKLSPWITIKDLLDSTWNSVHCYVAAWMGEDLGGNGFMIMYHCVPLLFTETVTTL